MNRWLLVLLVTTAFSQTACVTGRRTLSIPVPTASATPVTKGVIYISSVTGERVFQNKPSNPSIPSVDGNVNDLTPAQKDRMIGRQRNGFGRAMGDIALGDDDTVTRRVRLLVTEGLRRKGYEISTAPGAATSVAVSVNEFWAWTTPGFWALAFEAKLKNNTDVQRSGQWENHSRESRTQSRTGRQKRELAGSLRARVCGLSHETK